MKNLDTDDAIRGKILDAIYRIAPETDPKAIDPDLPLRDQVDLDSMDFFNLLISVEKGFGIYIAETDYQQFTTLRKCVDYVRAKLETPVLTASSTPKAL